MLALAGARYRYTKTLWITGLADKLTLYATVDEGLDGASRDGRPGGTSEGAMPSPDLADRAAALLSLAAATEERSLSQLTALAASQVAGCTAANVTVWRDGELTSQAASHPEPSRLVAVQIEAGSRAR